MESAHRHISPDGPGPEGERHPEEAMQRPIFILGSPRSGTSILMQALTRSVGLPGFNEGQFVELLLRLLAETERHYQSVSKVLSNPAHMISHVPKLWVRNRLITAFRDRAESFFHGPVWVDKTPGQIMVEGAPTLLEIWSGARIIFAKRRALENVASRMRKYPSVPFESHCKMWAFCMSAWLEVRPKLHDHALEVEQWDVAHRPAEAASAIARFLEIDPEKTKDIEVCFTTKTPESTGGAHAAALSLEGTGWSDNQVKTYRSICGETARRYGYTEDSSYCSAIPRNAKDP